MAKELQLRKLRGQQLVRGPDAGGHGGKRGKGGGLGVMVFHGFFGLGFLGFGCLGLAPGLEILDILEIWTIIVAQTRSWGAFSANCQAEAAGELTMRQIGPIYTVFITYSICIVGSWGP